MSGHYSFAQFVSSQEYDKTRVVSIENMAKTSCHLFSNEAGKEGSKPCAFEEGKTTRDKTEQKGERT